jgi:FlaG/FlaF family flagellin (archaellin)
MTNNKIKIIAPAAGAILTAVSGYYAGSQQSQTALEVAKIEAASRIEVAKIEVKGQMDVMVAKAELNKTAKAEANKAIINNSETANSPLELGELKDWIINFDPTSLTFETLVGIALLAGTLTSLLCILFLGIYVSIYKLDLPLENHYSGYMLKLVNFVKPYSDGFIVFYLTILISVQTILFILGLRLLSGF